MTHTVDTQSHGESRTYLRYYLRSIVHLRGILSKQSQRSILQTQTWQQPTSEGMIFLDLIHSSTCLSEPSPAAGLVLKTLPPLKPISAVCLKHSP